MINIINKTLSPSIEIKKVRIFNKNRIILNSEKDLPCLVYNHAFWWMIKTWIKNNNIPFEVDTNIEPWGDSHYLTISGKEIEDMEWFINNL